MASPKRIAIASSGRFHLLDLARELDELGFDVKFYSFLPFGRVKILGLRKKCHVSLLGFVFPFLLLQRVFPRFMPNLVDRGLVYALNFATILLLRRCDVFICLSGTYLEAARYAKQRFGAKIYLERGSRHILSQKEILSELAGVAGPTDFSVDRELQGYALADRIAVPAIHVVESFDIDKSLRAKLFRNPYGAGLDQFPARQEPSPDARAVLFVGAWTYRKGVDILVEAIKGLGDVTLLHVGSLGDAPFPDDPRFTHVDPVPQGRLKEFYAKANCFALASREEGLAMVQVQALASGLTLVCTDRTGGGDLAHSPTLSSRIKVVPVGDAAALREAISLSLKQSVAPGVLPDLTDEDRRLLSWRAYGQRYAAELQG